MTLAPNYPARTVRPGTIAVNMAAVSTFAIFGALYLEPMLGSRAVVVFLLVGGLLIISNIQHSLRYLVSFWYLFVLPAYCGLSIIWSVYPAETLRASLQLAITFAISVIIASRVPPRTFVRILFVVLWLTILASAGFGRVRDDIGAWLGIFNSKNAFAFVISTFALVCAVTLLDHGARRLERVMAGLGVLISGPLLLSAQSAGAIIMLAPGLVLAISLIVMKRVAPVHKQIFVAIIVLAGIFLAVVALFNWQQLLQIVLNSSGKDSTLTGRTDLWQTGLDYIAQSPLQGMGYRAFWVIGNPPAEQLWFDFGISTRTGFHFHNMYISNAVEIGLVGIGMQLVVFYGAFWLMLRWALETAAPAAVFLSSYLAVQILLSFIEVPVFFQFNIPTVITLVAFVYGVQARRYARER